jgi:ferrous iron transport protein B
MAIFFPLFTLLEDLGYLPRVAYNLDRPFRRCRASGKQALTSCMGFGCNAAGVVGCRIIDTPRERLLAILTNIFIPCNGRFPLLLTMLSLFFRASGGSPLPAALGLTAVIVFSAGCSLVATRLLSTTVLKGEPGSFVLELPPFRRPRIMPVLLRSLLDRTLFVLARAAAVAAPAGLLLWTLANLAPGGVSLMNRIAALLDPIGRFFGLDGAILLAFLLGLPANETVLPILLMIYTASGTLTAVGDMRAFRALLLQNGWTRVTALCVLVFCVLHWPCSTTLLTIRKETGRWRWALLAAALPTAFGLALCAMLAHMGR